MRSNIFEEKVSFWEFIRFVMPSILSMVFLSFYTTVDGYFVSKYVNSNALASINIIIPFTCIFFGLTIMLATGGGALVSYRLGSSSYKEANNLFSNLLLTLGFFIISLTILSLIFLQDILRICGSTPNLLPYTKVYGLYTVIMIPAIMSKLFLEHFLRVDDKAHLSMLMSISGLVLNIFFDYIFIVLFKMGIAGAGLGTTLSMYLSCFFGIFHFTSKKSILKISFTSFEFKTIFKSLYNGVSEMMTELSTGVTTLLFNLALIKLVGEKGVATMSILTYLYYFFLSIYFGIAVATQPIISYNLGKKALNNITRIVNQALIILLLSSLLLTSLSYIGASKLILFFSNDKEIYLLGVPALKLFSLTFLLSSFNIFFSSYFTAVKKGGTSAIISICRSLLFVLPFLYILPHYMGLSGIWLTNPLAELTTFLLSLIIIKIHKNSFYDQTKISMSSL